MNERRPTKERKRQIADAALRILTEQGVHRLTAANLGEMVGIADATIFRHFKNKEAIVHAAIERVAELLYQHFPTTEEDPLDRLGSFFLSRVRLVRERPEILRVALSDRLLEAAGESAAMKVEELTRRSMDFVRDWLRDAQRQGAVDPDIPVDMLTWMVTGVLRGAALGNEGAGSKKGRPEHYWKALRAVLTKS